MADVVVTIKIMPESPETDLEAIQKKATELVSNFGGEVGKTEIEPVAFGLKALNIIFVMNEDKGATDPLEEQIKELEGVSSAEAVDVRRAIG